MVKNPSSCRVVAGDQLVRHMGVEAFDSIGAAARMALNGGQAVLLLKLNKSIGGGLQGLMKLRISGQAFIHQPNESLRLKPAHRLRECPAGQPPPSRKCDATRQKWRGLNYLRRSTNTTPGDLPLAPGGTAQLVLHDL